MGASFSMERTETAPETRERRRDRVRLAAVDKRLRSVVEDAQNLYVSMRYADNQVTPLTKVDIAEL
jgi:hypothetical protein